MLVTREEILTAAMTLNAADREALAEELLLSLSDTEREVIDAAWAAEADRRAAALDRGEATSRPSDEVVARLRAKAQR